MYGLPPARIGPDRRQNNRMRGLAEPSLMTERKSA
jgi:hypothetical protein